MPKFFSPTRLNCDDDDMRELHTMLGNCNHWTNDAHLGGRVNTLVYLSKEYGPILFEKAIRKILYYYKMKIVNKISYDIEKARRIYITLCYFYRDLLDALRINGYAIARLGDTSYNDMDINTMDICIDTKMLSKFVKTEWNKIAIHDMDIMSDMMKEVMLDLYYMNGEKELDKGMKLVYDINGLSNILPLNVKTMTKVENGTIQLIFPAHFSAKSQNVNNLNKNQMNKAMVFGSYAKLMEECMEAYYENDMQKYLQEVGDIFITKYYIDMRKGLLNRGSIYETDSKSIILFYKFKLSESMMCYQPSWSFESYNMVKDMLPCDDLWHLDYNQTYNQSEKLDSDPYNILMYFKNKIEREL